MKPAAFNWGTLCFIVPINLHESSPACENAAPWTTNLSTCLTVLKRGNHWRWFCLMAYLTFHPDISTHVEILTNNWINSWYTWYLFVLNRHYVCQLKVYFKWYQCTKMYYALYLFFNSLKDIGDQKKHLYFDVQAFLRKHFQVEIR